MSGHPLRGRFSAGNGPGNGDGTGDGPDDPETDGDTGHPDAASLDPHDGSSRRAKKQALDLGHGEPLDQRPDPLDGVEMEPLQLSETIEETGSDPAPKSEYEPIDVVPPTDEEYMSVSDDVASDDADVHADAGDREDDRDSSFHDTSIESDANDEGSSALESNRYDVDEPLTDPGFDRNWRPEPVDEVPSTPAARKFLAALLIVLGLGWLGFAGWSAGQAMSGAIAADTIALWIAIACAPLILLALLWTIFGRTRRKEAEQFTQAVALMRAEAEQLDQRLHAMSHNLGANRTRLTEMAGELEGRADRASERLRSATSELEQEAGRLAQHGSSFDKSTSAARADMARIMETLPAMDEKVGALSQRLREAGTEVADHGERLEQAVAWLDSKVGETEAKFRSAGETLAGQLRAIDEASTSSLQLVDSAREGTRQTVDSLIESTAAALDQMRGGIEQQSAAVDALVQRARAGLDEAGGGAAAQLAARLQEADHALGGLGERVAAHDEQARSMIAQLDAGIGAVEERFERMARDGDDRAKAIGMTLQAVREQLGSTLADSREQDSILESLSTRTGAMREQLNGLSHFLNQQLAGDVGGAQDGMERLLSTSREVAPQVSEMRESATQASEQISQTAQQMEQSRETLAQLMSSVEEGTGGTQQRLSELQAAIASLQDDARTLTAETSPALVDSMVQVREAAERARDNVREAIAKAIPEGVGNLSQQAREAVAKAVEEAVLSQMRELDAVSTRAMDAARGASDRLSAQMLSIGQTASALEAHLDEVEERGREGQSERFAGQVAMLMESMNSAAIDVEKILSNDVDDKSWAAYLKGERGVFTRKAVRLLSTGEARELSGVYESDPEFRQAVNRFVHDFESMLRRVLAERDGGVMGVTLMSSDMGKLYTALAQVVERRG